MRKKEAMEQQVEAVLKTSATMKKVDQNPFPVHVLELNNPKVLVGRVKPNQPRRRM